MIDLKRFRKENNLSQKDICDILGVNQSFVSQMENFKRPIPKEYLDILKLKHNIDAYVISKDLNQLDRIDKIFSKDSSIQVDRIVDAILENKEKFEANTRFNEYIEGKKKDAIIEYQTRLIQESKKQ